MVFNPDPASRRSNTTAVTGDQGDPVAQDESSGQLLSQLTGNEGIAIDQDSAGKLISVLQGSEGIAIDQEADTGKALMRLGGEAAQADIDVGDTGTPHDLTSADYTSGGRDAGGAQYIAGLIVSDQSNTFSVKVDWLDDDGNVTATTQPSALTDATEVDFNLRMRSDKFEVTISDTSGAANNDIRGTINAH